MRSFGDQAALRMLADSHAVTKESIQQGTADTLRWLRTVRMPEGARQDMLAARSVERTKVNTIVLAMQEYAAWAAQPAPAPEQAIDPDRYYQEVRDRRGRSEESCRLVKELYPYGSGDGTKRWY